MTVNTGSRALIAGVLAAVGASVCRVGPLVPLALDIGGTWVGRLTAMQPYRPIFIGLTLLVLGLALRRLFLVPQVRRRSRPPAFLQHREQARLTWVK